MSNEDVKDTPVLSEADIHAPVDLRTFFLGGIFLLLLLAALEAAGSIILPVVLAIVLKLVLQPVMDFLDRIHLPRILGGLVVIAVLLGGAIAIGKTMAVPASEWAQELPRQLPKIKERLDIVRTPIEPLQKVLSDAQKLAEDAPRAGTVIAVQQPRLSDRFMESTRNFAAGFFETLLVLYFLLVAGDTFLRRLVEILPRFRNKKQAINITNQIQHDLSVYLMTITAMNAVVGVGTGITMALFGIEDPVLWGLIAFLLNYVPIIGPMACLILFGTVGLMSDLSLGMALVPALCYLAVHVTESQFVTPFLLARHFTLNPVLVILALIFFYWMWGVPGAILSTPIIAIIKIVCDHIERLKPFGHFIEG